MTGSQKSKQSKKDFRGKLVRYLASGDYGIVLGKTWIGHYIVMLTDGKKIVVTIGDEHSLVDIV